MSEKSKKSDEVYRILNKFIPVAIFIGFCAVAL